MLDKSNIQDYKAYQMLVKKRIYVQNQDVLEDMPKDERNSKIHEVYVAVEGDYHEILAKISK